MSFNLKNLAPGQVRLGHGLPIIHDQDGVKLFIGRGKVAFSRAAKFKAVEFEEPLSRYRGVVAERINPADPLVEADPAGSVCRVFLSHLDDRDKDIELYRSTDSAGLDDEAAVFARVLGVPKAGPVVPSAEPPEPDSPFLAEVDWWMRLRSALGPTLVAAMAAMWASQTSDHSQEIVRLDVARGGAAQILGPVALSLEHNGYRPEFRVEYSTEPPSAQNQGSTFTFSMKDGNVNLKARAGDALVPNASLKLTMKDAAGAVLWRQEASVPAAPALSTVKDWTANLNTFSISSSGDYSFEADFRVPAEDRLKAAALIFRRDVQPAPGYVRALWFAAAGCAFFCLFCALRLAMGLRAALVDVSGRIRDKIAHFKRLGGSR